jgi:hypothetical protein
MNAETLYATLFGSLAPTLGPLNSDTLTSIIGFDAGGPLSLCAFAQKDQQCTTYVSCELVFHQPLDGPRYELLVTCDDEDWARTVLSEIGKMSLEVTFAAGHTIDIGPLVGEGDTLQGVVFEEATKVRVAGSTVSILRVVGLTRPEMEYVRAKGWSRLKAKLRKAGVYPRTPIGRLSVV